MTGTALFDDPSVPLDRWRANHCQFVHHNFGVQPDRWQQQVLQHTSAKNQADEQYRKIRLAMQSCANTGKTAMLAWLIWIFQALYATRLNHPKGIATSINKANLMGNLWPELSKWLQRSPFLQRYFKWSASKVFNVDHPSTWFVEPRAWPRTARPEEIGNALSGVHGRFTGVFSDETGGSHKAVKDRAEQTMGGVHEWSMFAQAGNPLDRDSCLGHSVRDDDYFVMRITADPDDPDRTSRVSKAYAAKKIKDRGRDDPWVEAFILGKFPKTAINALLSEDDIEASVRRRIQPEDYQWAAMILAADVASQGLDQSVIGRRQGLHMWPVERFSNVDSIQGAALLAHRYDKFRADAIHVDNTGGFGSGWIDQLKAGGYPVTPVEYSGKDHQPEFFNKRAGMYWRLSQWVKQGGRLPDDPELHRELLAHTYSFKGDRLIVCDKDDVKDQLDGHSPDSADATAQLHAFPVAAPRLSPALQAAKGRRVKTFKDPFDRCRE